MHTPFGSVTSRKIFLFLVYRGSSLHELNLLDHFFQSRSQLIEVLVCLLLVKIIFFPFIVAMSLLVYTDLKTKFQVITIERIKVGI